MQVTALAMTPRMFAVNACIYLFTVSYLVVSYYHYAHVDSENRLQNCPEVIMNYKFHRTPKKLKTTVIGTDLGSVINIL